MTTVMKMRTPTSSSTSHRHHQHQHHHHNNHHNTMRIFTHHEKHPLNRLVFMVFLSLSIVANHGSTGVVFNERGEVVKSSFSNEDCEPKTIDVELPDPFYDSSEITIITAKKLGEFVAKNPRDPEAVRNHANILAIEALKADENLLAFALASPSVPMAAVQFRDKINNSTQSSNRTFLSIYWKELGIAWNQSDGAQFWGSPFRDCGPLLGRWLWPFSVTAVVYKTKIVASSFIAADQDACNDALEPIFGKRHSCDRKTTFCLTTENEIDYDTQLLSSKSSSSSAAAATASASYQAKYTCVCQVGFYVPNETLQGFPSDKIENEDGNFSCIPCPNGCKFCDKDGYCNNHADDEDSLLSESLLKAIIGSVLGVCFGTCFLLSCVVYRRRKHKTIASGMWTILVTILGGISLLYAAVAIHFLPSSSTLCMLESWLREIGFVICYGAIVLKLYRHLVEFRTRKAHRHVVRDLDLLRYLCAMIVAVFCYMAAYTALCVDYMEFSKLTWNIEIETIATSNMCKPLKWDYVTQAGELLILMFGIQISYAIRNANTQFKERQFLVASIFIEFIVSLSYYIIRDWYLSELNPTTLLLALFIRSQLTSTVILILIFGPKLYYQHKKDLHDASHHNHHHGLSGYAGVGDPEIGDFTISEMSPEEIRAELKRLYTQLEYLKNKTMRRDNPHISKRRGGRKVAHRRFSLQALSARHKRPPPSQEIEVTEAEPSRTPEESVCSIEGPTDTGNEPSAFSSSK